MPKSLYLGLDPSHYFKDQKKAYIHFPIIQIIPTPLQELIPLFHDFSLYTHLIFTSKTAVLILSEYLAQFGTGIEVLKQKICISVGKVTTQHLQSLGVDHIHTASPETAEGVIALFPRFSKEHTLFFWPHSALSRSLISDYLQAHGYQSITCQLYDTRLHSPEVSFDWDEIDEIIFTSPSTVQAFITLFGQLPENKQLTAIGPITTNALRSCVNSPISTK